MTSRAGWHCLRSGAKSRIPFSWFCSDARNDGSLRRVNGRPSQGDGGRGGEGGGGEGTLSDTNASPVRPPVVMSFSKDLDVEVTSSSLPSPPAAPWAWPSQVLAISCLHAGFILLFI